MTGIELEIIQIFKEYKVELLVLDKSYIISNCDTDRGLSGDLKFYIGRYLRKLMRHKKASLVMAYVLGKKE
jgi:hypothetical protein